MAQNFRNFMQFFGNFWQNCRLVPPPGGLAPPPVENPGSASAQVEIAPLANFFFELTVLRVVSVSKD